MPTPAGTPQLAAVRGTEGGTHASMASKTVAGITHSERKRGRPKGSANKPKALISKEIASELLGVVKAVLPPDLYRDMEAAVKSGKNISTLSEAKILMKLMGPPVWFRLIEESKKKQPSLPVGIDPDLIDELGPMEPETPQFDKDLNERIKVLLNVMQFVDRLESNDSTANNTEKPIFEIFARKGIDAARIEIIAGGISGALGRNPDGIERAKPVSGTVSGEFSEGQGYIQDSEQGETVGIFHDSSIGDDSGSSDEAEL